MFLKVETKYKNNGVKVKDMFLKAETKYKNNGV